MKPKPQKNRWSKRSWNRCGFVLALMPVIGFFVFIPGAAHGSYAWHTFYGSSDLDNGGNGIAVDGSGNVYVTGHGRASWQGDGGTNPLHPHSGGSDFFIMKLNREGLYEWHTFYGSAGEDYGLAVAVDKDGNIYVTGQSRASWNGGGGVGPLHPYNGDSDVFVLKLDSHGTYQWHTFYGSSAYDSGQGIAVDAAGNVYVTGVTRGTWNGDAGANPLHAYNQGSDLFVMKLDTNGAYQWHTFYGSGTWDGGAAIALDKSGGVYIAGSSEASWQGNGGTNPLHPFGGGTSNALVLKLGNNGAYQWHTFYGESGYNDFYGIAADESGSIYLSGASLNWKGDGGANPLHAHNGDADIVALKLTSNGTYLWHTFYGSDRPDYGYGIASEGKGGLFISGGSLMSWQGNGDSDPMHAFSGSNRTDSAVLKLDSDGIYQWHTFYGSGSEDSGRSIAVDNGGNVFVTGGSNATWKGDGDVNPLHAYSGDYDTFVLALAPGVQPREGTLGTEITIKGSGFGTKKNKVLLGSASLKILEWKDSMVRCSISKTLPSGVYDLTVQPYKASPILFEDAFTIEPPVIGDLEPANGSINEEITIWGRFFGTKKSKVTLGGKNCRVLSWTMNTGTGASEAKFVVPRGLSAGPHELKITNGVGSDAVNFNVD